MEIEQTLGKFFESVHQKMNSGVFYQDILESIFTFFDPLVPFDRICIGLYEEEGQKIRFIWVKSKLASNLLKKGYVASLEGSSLGRLLKTSQVRVIEDMIEYGRFHKDSETVKISIQDGIRSALTIPLVSNGETFGCMFFSSTKPNTYKSKHVNFFEKISGGLSLVLEQGLVKQSMNEFHVKEKVFRNTIHDLNNPLFVMKGTLEIATRKDWFHGLNAESRKAFMVLERSCEAMINLMRDLNVMHEPDRKNQVVYLQRQSLRNFLAEVIEENETLAFKKNIKLRLTTDPNLPCEVNIDSHRLREILANLISNAIKFSHHHTCIELMVNFEESTSRLYFSVLDQGQGIPAEEISLLFKEFGKTSVKPTGGEHSCGLGLSNVKRIVQYLGGDVSAESEWGRGSKFSFWIPLPDLNL